MKSAFTHLANLEAARDDSSMNLNFYCVQYVEPCHQQVKQLGTVFDKWTIIITFHHINKYSCFAYTRL